MHLGNIRRLRVVWGAHYSYFGVSTCRACKTRMQKPILTVDPDPCSFTRPRHIASGNSASISKGIFGYSKFRKPTRPILSCLTDHFHSTSLALQTYIGSCILNSFSRKKGNLFTPARLYWIADKEAGYTLQIPYGGHARLQCHASNLSNIQDAPRTNMHCGNTR